MAPTIIHLQPTVAGVLDQSFKAVDVNEEMKTLPMTLKPISGENAAPLGARDIQCVAIASSNLAFVASHSFGYP